MANNNAAIQSVSGTKIVCSLPPPPPIPDALKNEILSQYELMMASLSPESLTGADDGGKSRTMNRDRMKASKLSNDENAEILKQVTLSSSTPTQLRAERIALSDKYKRFRRKVNVAPKRDPRLHVSESIRTASNQNPPQKHTGWMNVSPHSNQPLKQQNLISNPISDTHVNQSQQQPQRETYREYKIRKQMEMELEAERKCKAQKGAEAVAASFEEATTIDDGQRDGGSKLKREVDQNKNGTPFKMPKMIKSPSGSGYSTIVRKEKETYRDYRRRKEMEEADKRKADAGDDVDENW